MALPPLSAAAAAPLVPAINWWFEGLKILVTAGLSIAGTGIFIGLWQLRERYIEERISELIDEVDAAADLATEYWSSSRPARGRKFRETVAVDVLKDRAMEADLVARVGRIGRMRATVGEYLDRKKMQALFEDEGELNSAFTGGDFRSPGRICEPERFDMIREHAALYIGLIREARHARLAMPWYKRLIA
jgi:hypothetical protein